MRRQALIIEGDCLSVMHRRPADFFDSVVTDPPYELGFMGKAWDGTGIAYSVELWREVLRVLKPGGYLLSFGGTRTYHRMTCAIEDAGFEIRDSLHWMYGTGFPKSLNVGDGRGTALKPGHEPIVLARKPLEGTVAANVQAHGTGTLNIDGCRIGTESRVNAPASSMGANGIMNHGREWTKQNAGPKACVGRWPTNVLLDEDAAAELDAQTGHLGRRGNIGPSRSKGGTRSVALSGPTTDRSNGAEYSRGDSGGASRFFYVAKPNRKERGSGNNHPTVKPIELMRYLVRLVTPPGGTVLDPFLGSGTTALACVSENLGIVGIEKVAEYIVIAKRRIGL